MRASLILNGDYKGTLFITGNFIVAVDGGADALRRRKIVPHAIVGDMDSVKPETLQYFSDLGVEIVRYPPEKDETDLELALRYAFEHGATEVEILNWHGERIDMLMAMMGLIGRYGNAVAVSEKCDIAVLGQGTHELSAIKGELWSLLPLCEADFAISGFKYSFDGVMHLESPIGVSNQATSERVSVSVRRGKVVCVRWKKKPL